MKIKEIVPDLSLADRQCIHAYIQNPQQTVFLHVGPAETGLSRTIWLSQNENCPALLVSPAPGRLNHPPKDVLVVGLKENTPFADVNEWLSINRHLFLPLAKQELDVGHFYDRMKKCQR